jgi:hypothetical protein
VLRSLNPTCFNGFIHAPDEWHDAIREIRNESRRQRSWS